MNKVINVILVVFVVACTNEGHSRTVLENAGYTKINMTGYEWLGCGENDGIHDGFSAVGPNGRMVKGTVCCGRIFKNCTIRFE